MPHIIFSALHVVFTSVAVVSEFRFLSSLRIAVGAPQTEPWVVSYDIIGGCLRQIV